MRTLTLVGLAALSTPALAWESTDGFYYFAGSNSLDADAPVHSFVDISSTGTVLGISSIDDSFQSLSGLVDFTFSFYGVDYTEDDVFVTTNGTVAFGDPMSNFCCSAQSLPSSLFPVPIVNIIQEDVHPSSAGDLHVQVVGDEVVIQYTNTPFFNSTGNALAQARLDTVTGEVIVAHASVDTGGNTISVGVQRDSATAIQAFFDNAPPAATSYLFQPVDTAQDLLDFAIASLPEIDSGPARLSSGSQLLRLGAVQNAASAGQCILVDALAGDYESGVSIGDSEFFGTDTASATFSFSPKTFTGDIDGVGFGSVSSGFDKNGRLFATIDGSDDVIAGRWTRVVGSRGIWIAGVFSGCSPDAFSRFPAN